MVPAFKLQPVEVIDSNGVPVHRFAMAEDGIDRPTVEFSNMEWRRFGRFSQAEIEDIAADYFDILPPELLAGDVQVLDAGCGSGRWTRYLAPKVGHIHAVDASDAVIHAASVHRDLKNVTWSQASVHDLPFEPGSFDLVVCLGVLHHVPHTELALQRLVQRLEPNGHLLLYLYYALEGRGWLYRSLFAVSQGLRQTVSRLPVLLKRIVCDLLATLVYLPLSRAAGLAKRAGVKGWAGIPLAYYRDKPFHIMRNDALDRFGMPLEKRYTKQQVQRMMKEAGLQVKCFSSGPPYWHVLGQRAARPT